MSCVIIPSSSQESKSGAKKRFIVMKGFPAAKIINGGPAGYRPTVVWLDKIELEEAELYEDYVLYELREDQRVISRETLIFCQPKNFCFRIPKLQYRIEGDEVVVYSSAYARCRNFK